jgi:tetratricopeptide (TPR) repeat protein
MTTHQEKLAEEKRLEEAQKALAAKQAEAHAQRLKAEEDRLRQQAEKVERELARQAQRREAAVLLAGGDAQGAYDLVRKIFEPEPEVRTSDLGVEEKVAVPPPELEPQEEAHLHMIAGTALHELGRTDEAIVTLRRALELDGSLRDARRNLGQILFLQRDYAGALEVWTQELADGYRDAKLLFLVAQARYEVYHKTKNAALLESARAALEQVVVETPEDPEVTRWLAVVQYECGRYEEAIRLFEVIRRSNPLDSQYLELLANCHIKLRDYGEATRFLELAASLKPPTREAMKTLGDLYMSQDLPDVAAEWYVKAYADDPASAPPSERLHIGMLFAEAGKVGEAVRWLDSVPEGDGDYARARSHLAHLYQDLGRTEEALASFEKAGASQPDNGLAHLSAADIYLERRDLEAAHRAYTKASALPDTAGEGLAGLAEVEYAKGNLPAAIKYYRDASESSPGNVRFVVALKEIEEELNLRAQETADNGK